MKFFKWIKKLEKKGVVSRWPPVWLPFVLVVILLAEGFFFPFSGFKGILYYLAGFAFLFAIVHWKVVGILNRKS